MATPSYCTHCGTRLSGEYRPHSRYSSEESAVESATGAVHTRDRCREVLKETVGRLEEEVRQLRSTAASAADLAAAAIAGKR